MLLYSYLKVIKIIMQVSLKSVQLSFMKMRRKTQPPTSPAPKMDHREGKEAWWKVGANKEAKKTF